MGYLRRDEMQKPSTLFFKLLLAMVVVSLCLITMPAPVRAEADTEPLRPNADGQYTEWAISDSTHHGATSDQSDTTYVYSSTNEAKEVLNLADPTFGESDTVNSVAVNVKCRVIGGGVAPEKFNIMMRTHDTDYDTNVNVAAIDDVFTWHYGTAQTINPNTGLEWTKSEVIALQAGLRITTIGGGETIQCSEIEVVVDYTPLPPAFDFSVGASPSSCTVAQGDSTSTTINVTLVSGATEDVTLSGSWVGTAPGGVTPSFVPSSGTPHFSSTLTFLTTVSATTGTFTYRVKGTGGGKEHTTDVTLIITEVVGFNFSVSASPDNLTFRQGENASSTISVSLVSGTAETVLLSGSWVGMPPTGISTVFSSQSGTPPFSSTLTFTASSTASGGAFTYEVTGSGGGLTRTHDITLMLPPAAPSLVSPENGMAIDTNTPAFDWDDVAGAVSYTLQVATDDNFSYTVFSTDVVESTKTSPVSLSYGTRHYWRIRAKNDVGTGDWSSTWSFTAKLTAPKVLSFQIEAGGQYTNSTNVELTISARNAVEMSFSGDGVMWGEWEPYQTPKSYTLEAPDGPKNVYIKVRDNVGDIGQMTLDSIILDQAPPSTTHSLSGDLGAEGYKGSVVVRLASTDAYGVESTNYRIDNDEWRTGHTFVVSSDGKHTIGYYSTDAAGNEEEIKSFQVTVYTPTILPPILIKYWWAFLGTIVAVGVASVFVTRKVRLSGRLKRIGKEKREIIKLMKEAETKYYKEGSITRDTFDELMRGHEKRAAELEKEERVLKAKVKKVKGKQVEKKRKRRR